MSGNVPNWTEEDIYLVANHAYALYREGQLKQAKIIFEGLLDIDPDHSYSLDALSAISFALDRPQDCVEHSSHLLHSNPEHTEALARRCEAWLQLGRLEKARNDLDRLKRLGARAHSGRLQLRLDTFLHDSSLSPADTGSFDAQSHNMRAREFDK